MKALVMDGAPNGDTLTMSAARTTADTLARAGYEVEVMHARDMRIAACTGCFGCWTRKPGECVIDDDAREVAAAAIASDVFAVVSPIRFGTWGSTAKGVMDRYICLILPFFTTVGGEVHHELRYPAYPAYVGIGTQVEPDEPSAEAFRFLVGRNAHNWHNPPHAAAVVTPGDDIGAAVASALAEARIDVEVPA